MSSPDAPIGHQGHTPRPLNGPASLRRPRREGTGIHAFPPPDRDAPAPALAWPGDTQPEFESLIRRQLELLGEDPDRAGLQKTPERVAKSLTWLTQGRLADIHELVGEALFEESHENMVVVRDIEFYSLCEHHMLPFFGKVHVAYVPNGRIVGLSKLARIVEAYARRLQVQERLTEQVAEALEEVLAPRGVGVIVEAAHLCMMMRGVGKQGARTFTSALTGQFRECPSTRDQFLRLAHQGR